MTRRLVLLWLLVLASVALAQEEAKVPGVVIAHRAASSGIYIGSPSLAVLANGELIASHDEFGPKSTLDTRGVTRVYRSADRGSTWTETARVEGQFWSTLFVHRDALYLLGTSKQSGNVVIRRSTDRGKTWTTPADAKTGLLRDDEGYHCAPTPVVVHGGRLWRGIERRFSPRREQNENRAGMMSAPVDADLLDATSWTFSNFLERDPAWLDGGLIRWLEGNAVVTPDGRLVDVMRLDTQRYPERVALIDISPDGKTASIDPATAFVDFPGGAKKFTIRFDPKSRLYWSLATVVPARHQGKSLAGLIRNTLALTCSRDLRTWETRCVLIYHRDTGKHGYQYVDWHFDGDDLIAVCRTTHDDAEGGAGTATTRTI